MMKNKWLFIAIFIAGMLTGAFGIYKWQVEPLQQERAELESQVKGLAEKNIALQKSVGILEQAKDEVRTEFITVRETDIQYVEKEVDPLTGQREKTDVQVDIDPQKVNLLVNGKPYETAILAGETYAFENGKLVLKQTSMATIDVQLPEVERKGFRFGPYMDYGTGDKDFDAGFKLRYERKKWDVDAAINQDKDVGVGVQYWLK